MPSTVIVRLLRKAGVKMAAASVHGDVKSSFRLTLQDVMEMIVRSVTKERRSTVLPRDVRYAAQAFGVEALLPPADEETEQVPKCPAKAKAKDKAAPKSKVAAAAAAASRARKQTADVQFYQAQDGCVFVPKATFLKLVKEAAPEAAETLRFGKVGLDHMQLLVESMIVVHLKKAYLLTTEVANKTTLSSREMQAAAAICAPV